MSDNYTNIPFYKGSIVERLTRNCTIRNALIRLLGNFSIGRFSELEEKAKRLSSGLDYPDIKALKGLLALRLIDFGSSWLSREKPDIDYKGTGDIIRGLLDKDKKLIISLQHAPYMPIGLKNINGVIPDDTNVALFTHNFEGIGGVLTDLGLAQVGRTMNGKFRNIKKDTTNTNLSPLKQSIEHLNTPDGNNLLLIAGDEHRANEDTSAGNVTFLNRTVQRPLGILKIAQMTDSPILPLAIVLDGQGKLCYIPGPVQYLGTVPISNRVDGKKVLTPKAQGVLQAIADFDTEMIQQYGQWV